MTPFVDKCSAYLTMSKVLVCEMRRNRSRMIHGVDSGKALLAGSLEQLAMYCIASWPGWYFLLRPRNVVNTNSIGVWIEMQASFLPTRVLFLFHKRGTENYRQLLR